MTLSSSERQRTSGFVVDADGRIKTVLSDSSGALQGNTVDTELPAAAALGDSGTDVQSMPNVGAALLGRDGASNVLRRVQTMPVDNINSQFALTVVPSVYNGATLDRPRDPNVFKTFANTAITAGTAISVWTPTSGKKFRLMGMTMSVSATTQVLVCDNTNATIIFRSPLFAAAATFTIGSGDMGNGIISTTINNVLKLDATANASVAGTVWGVEE